MTDSMIAAPAATPAPAHPAVREILGRVLVAIDGSHAAHAALLQAVELARQYGGELLVCTVIDKAAAIVAASAGDGAALQLDTVLAHYAAAASSLVSEAALQVSAAGARVTTMVLEGHPARTIAEYAADCGAAAIVLGTHGKRGLERMFLGSTAEGVLRLTNVPTFIVHVRHEASTPDAAVPAAHAIGRILVAVDESDPSDAAATFAADLAAVRGSTLLVAHAIELGDVFDRAESFGYNPAPLLESMRESADELVAVKVGVARERGITADPLVIEGNVPEAIVDAADAVGADLIVVGTHGRRGLRRLVMGSVAEGIVRRSAVPVAVVRAAAAGRRTSDDL